MTIDAGYEIVTSVFQNTLVFNIEWIISLALLFVSLILITKDYNQWKKLSLPVIVGWYICGITPNYLILVISAMLFVVDTLSIQSLGQILTVSSESAMRGAEGLVKHSWIGRIKRQRLDRKSRTSYGKLATDKSFKEKVLPFIEKREKSKKADTTNITNIQTVPEEWLRYKRER